MSDTPTKEAGVIVHLVEELGDARLRCEQLAAYVSEAIRLIEDSPHKDHFFEVAGHLLHAAPVTLQKLQRSLQAVALAANQMDSEELKRDLRPEKVDQLEKALESVRIRQIRRRSEPPMITPQFVAEKLRQIAATTREFQLPQTDVVYLIAALEEGQQKQAKETVPLADMLDKFADVAEAGNHDWSRLAAVLRRMVGDVHVKGTLAALQEEPGGDDIKTAGASEALKFKDLTKKRLPRVIKDGKAVDAWIADVESTLGAYVDLLAHDKWAKEKLFLVLDEVRELKFKSTRFRATLATLRKVLDQNYVALAQSINPDEAKTEPEWGEFKRADDLAWKVGATKVAVKLPSEEDGGKPGYDKDFAAGFAAGKKALKSDDSLSLHDAKSAFRKVKGHGSWWVDGFAAAIDLHRGAYNNKGAQIAKKMKLASNDEDKQSRFEEGKPADPTKNMSPEDAKKWKTEHDKNKDKFKAASDPWKVDAASDEDKQSRFEEGKPADPTKNMSPEDAKKWKVEHDKNKDKFKKEAKADIPVELGYDALNIFQRYWEGQGDPLYAMFSRRGNSVSIVSLNVSRRELDRFEDVAKEIVKDSDDASEVRVAKNYLKKIPGWKRGKSASADTLAWKVEAAAMSEGTWYKGMNRAGKHWHEVLHSEDDWKA